MTYMSHIIWTIEFYRIPYMGNIGMGPIWGEMVSRRPRGPVHLN